MLCHHITIKMSQSHFTVSTLPVVLDMHSELPVVTQSIQHTPWSRSIMRYLWLHHSPLNTHFILNQPWVTCDHTTVNFTHTTSQSNLSYLWSHCHSQALGWFLLLLSWHSLRMRYFTLQPIKLPVSTRYILYSFNIFSQILMYLTRVSGRCTTIHCQSRHVNAAHFTTSVIQKDWADTQMITNRHYQ